jgi:hypothetical protein
VVVQRIRERAAERVLGVQSVARITTRGSFSDAVDLKQGESNAAKSDLDGRAIRSKDLTTDYDLDAIEVEATVRGQFVKEVRDSALPEDEKQRVLTVGLRALDGRKDLELL